MSGIFSFPGKSDPQRFAQLVEPHLQHLYRLAFRFCGNRADAEDLVQDLVVKLYPRYGELAAVEMLRPWLARALYYLYIDQARRYRRSPLEIVEADDPQLLAVPDPAATPEQAQERRQFLGRLQHHFDRLSDEHRTLLALHDMEGYNLPELAEIFDVPVGTLKSRLHRARSRLRELLEKDGTF